MKWVIHARNETPIVAATKFRFLVTKGEVPEVREWQVTKLSPTYRRISQLPLLYHHEESYCFHSRCDHFAIHHLNITLISGFRITIDFWRYPPSQLLLVSGNFVSACCFEDCNSLEDTTRPSPSGYNRNGGLIIPISLSDQSFRDSIWMI